MTAAPEAGKRAASPDWLRAAMLLARGEALGAVAQRIGCSRSGLSRKRNHDPGFRSWIEQFQKAEQNQSEERLARLRRAVDAAIDKEVGNGNVRVVLWLAERLKMLTPEGERAPDDDLQQLLKELTPEEVREFETLRDPT